jgi:hypothetical protein
MASFYRALGNAGAPPTHLIPGGSIPAATAAAIISSHRYTASHVLLTLNHAQK